MDLLVFEVFLAPAVPLCVVGVGVLGIALVAVVGRNRVLVLGLGLLLMINVWVFLCSGELLQCLL